MGPMARCTSPTSATAASLATTSSRADRGSTHRPDKPMGNRRRFIEQPLRRRHRQWQRSYRSAGRSIHVDGARTYLPLGELPSMPSGSLIVSDHASRQYRVGSQCQRNAHPRERSHDREEPKLRAWNFALTLPAIFMQPTPPAKRCMRSSAPPPLSISAPSRTA